MRKKTDGIGREKLERPFEENIAIRPDYLPHSILAPTSGTYEESVFPSCSVQLLLHGLSRAKNNWLELARGAAK